jgi:ribosome maturation factor RimP
MKRREIADQVRVLAAPIAARLGLDIVDLELQGAGRHQIVRVLVDRDGGVGVEECAALSEALGREMDLYDLPITSYTLEVASPGLDRPLRTAEEFVRFSGRNVSVTTFAPVGGQRRFKGRLLGMVDDAVAVHLEDGREVRFSPADIAQARLTVGLEDLRDDLRRSS